MAASLKQDYGKILKAGAELVMPGWLRVWGRTKLSLISFKIFVPKPGVFKA
jgi:hypothetical protein